MSAERNFRPAFIKSSGQTGFKMRKLLVILLASVYILFAGAVNSSSDDHLSQIADNAKKCAENFSTHDIYRKCDLTAKSNENAVNISKKDSNHRALVEKFKSLWPVKDWEEHGLFTESYLDLMNEHWLKFPPPSPQVQITLGLTYMVLNGVGGLGNLLVIFMYYRFVCSNCNNYNN